MKVTSKILSFALALAMAVSVMSSCGKKNSSNSAAQGNASTVASTEVKADDTVEKFFKSHPDDWAKVEKKGKSFDSITFSKNTIFVTKTAEKQLSDAQIKEKIKEYDEYFTNGYANFNLGQFAEQFKGKMIYFNFTLNNADGTQVYNKYYNVQA